MKDDNRKQQVLTRLASIYQPGTLNIIGGRPGMGKTTVAFQLALAAHQPTLYISLEMSRQDLLLRYTMVEWIHVDDELSMTVEMIRTKVRQLQETDSIRWVIIDYLQLVCSSQKYPSRVAESKAILEEFKTMAVERNVAVIVLSQLSQKVELRDDKKPILQDIREAGPNFSSFVDDVRLLFRADYYHIANKDSHNICEILSTECRHNDLGDLHLPFSEMTLSLSVHKNIQKQTDIAQLRIHLASVEERIIRYTRPFDVIIGESDYKEKQIRNCLEERAAILDRMFELHCTEAEVRRFEHVNQRLLEVTNRFYQECQQLRQQLDQLPDYRRMTLYSEVNYSHDPENPQLFAMEEDHFYGSHWNEMLWALSMSATTDAHTIINGETNDLDDGLTWAEGALAIPQLEHICVCFLAHALCTHLHYSVPDLLRMTTYCCDHNIWKSSEAKI